MWKEFLSEIQEHLKYLKENDVEGLSVPHFAGDDPSCQVNNKKTGSEDIGKSSSRKKKNELLLHELRMELGDCVRCKLHRNRTNIVFGSGNPEPELVFVGEGPGYDEDMQGIPFVGRAGRLLNKIIAAMGMKREEVYICNVVKCRPPGNRNPDVEEIRACSTFLLRQLEILDPKVICTLGNVAACFLLGRKAPMRILRGRFHEFRGICLRATYHPAALLRNPSLKRPVWEDIKDIMRYLGKPIR